MSPTAVKSVLPRLGENGAEHSPACRTTVESRTGTAVYLLTGELDSSSARPTRRILATATGLENVIFDLSGLRFIDAVGVGVVVGGVRRVQEAEGTAVLVIAPGAVAKALEVAGVEHLTPVVGTLDAATQSEA